MMSRIDPDRIANLRDSADLSHEGPVLRRGQLLRSGHLHQADRADLDALFDAGVRRVIDFRDDTERERAPSPHWPDVETEHRSIRDPEFNIDRLIERVMNRETAEVDLPRQIREAYARFPYSHTRSLSAPARALLEESGAVLVHCTAGKDRTGLSVALVQLAVGVSYDRVLSHYLASTKYLADTNSIRIRTLAAALPDPEWIVPALEVRAEYLDAALESIITTDGSIGGYLERWEMTDEDWARLRSRMVIG